MVDVRDKIKANYKPKEGFSVHLGYVKDEMVACVFRKEYIKSKKYNITEETSLSVANIRTADGKKLKEFLMKYLDEK